MNAARSLSHDGNRRALLAKVHIARKELALGEDSYRDLLERVTGKRSAGELDNRQLVLVVDELKGKGFSPAPRTRPKAASSPAAGKARALWISLHQLGVVRNPSEQALESFGKRQLKVERLVWADDDQMYRLIEALKDMAERAGWSQKVSPKVDGRRRTPDEVLEILKTRLAEAIARRRAEGLIK